MDAFRIYSRMIPNEVREARPTPIRMQTGLLGIDQTVIKGLHRRSVLDVGCGVDGSLVRFLTSKGIKAEGIDPAAPQDDPRFIVKPVISMGQNNGGIPRPDRTYKPITSFQNTSLNVSFDQITFDCARPSEERIIEGHSLLNEMFRVLDSKGKIVVYPPIPKAPVVMSLSLTADGIVYREEPVDKRVERAYQIWDRLSDAEEDLRLEGFRSVFTKR